MSHLLRILALLLALSAGGVFETLAYAAPEHSDCEEEPADDCTDCAPMCDACVCCRVRAAPASDAVAVLRLVARDEPVVRTVKEPVVAALITDIFQPPRA